MSCNIELVCVEGKFNKDFNGQTLIGFGSFGSVYKVNNKRDNSIHAIKMIKFENINDMFWVSGIRELKALQKAKSDFVVQYRDAWIESKCLYFQMECCDNNLNDIIKDKLLLFDSKDFELSLIEFFISSEIFEEIVLSLNYLHTLNPPIIHRDIKPENILISYKRNKKQFIKLCDFGYAKPHLFSGQSNTRDTGNVTFMAPEVGRSTYYDIKSDVYSLALIGHKLFDIEFDRWKQSISKKHFDIQSKYSSLETLIVEMLETICRKRPSCAQVLAKSIVWRLSRDEIQSISGFHKTIEKLQKRNDFFYTFLLNKIDLRLNCPSHDFSDPSSSLSDQKDDIKVNNESDIEIKSGDILQISFEGNQDLMTFWALYLGKGFVLYLKDINNDENYRLVKENLEEIKENKDYKDLSIIINNLENFAQTRGLFTQNAKEIKRSAKELFSKYSNKDLKDFKHNLKIHFVTKCRYGKEICPKIESTLEEESVFFQI